jgi:hypothetical protein
LPLVRAEVKFVDGVRREADHRILSQLTVDRGKPPDHDRPIHNI